ncbi:MAG: hypothetical protein R2911_15730 [Caldilineaceae bacterium]
MSYIFQSLLRIAACRKMVFAGQQFKEIFPGGERLSQAAGGRGARLWMMCRLPLRRAETVSLVGESGCGKTTTTLHYPPSSPRAAKFCIVLKRAKWWIWPSSP